MFRTTNFYTKGVTFIVKFTGIGFILFSCSTKKVESPIEVTKEVSENVKDIAVDSIKKKSSNFSSIKDYSSYIIGKWISEEDTTWQLIFSEEKKCIQYFGDGGTETDLFSISNTSPQCGKPVSLDENNRYLQLINLGEEKDTTCYEIYALENGILTLRPVGHGGFMVFNKK